MPNCSPQRFLANHRNLIASATLVPSHVKAISNAVVETLLARSGTAQLKISGDYTGIDDATYDFEITDGDAETKLISAPAFTGAGSETLTDIVATTVDAQDFKIECHSAGQLAVAAAIEIEGVSVLARTPGLVGNGIHINIDVSGLTFTDTTFSLIEDVAAGDGSEAQPLTGPQYDWDTATVGADNNIPDSATTADVDLGLTHRVAFAGDDANIYLQYKKFVDGDYKYYFVPALKNAYAAGTRVRFVTGTYTASIIDSNSPPATEALAGIVTAYDFLNAVKTTSTLADVEGIIANDRSPTGQASRELSLRTQARALMSTGTGSKAATGFANISVETDANTELVTAECIAIDSKLDQHAYVGHEAWELKGSVSGALGTIYTGEAFSGATFGLTIPVKTPATSGADAGTISMTDFTHDSDAPPVQVCVAGKLGPNAVDQTLTLTLTARPPASCDCTNIPIPELNTPCLGGTETEGSAMGYSTDAQSRIDALYDWVSSLAAAVTTYVLGKQQNGITEGSTVSFIGGGDVTATSSGGIGPTQFSETVSGVALSGATATIPYVGAAKDTGFADFALPGSFTSLIDQYDTTLQAIDALGAGAPQTAGFSAWDDAVAAIEADLTTSAIASLGSRIGSVATGKYQIMLRRALAAGGISPVGKSSASSQTSGDGCWQDFGDALFWKVVGADGEYAPAFTNHAYWGARKNADGIYFSTHEFGIFIGVACPENLREGDTITIAIGNSAALGTYQVGDVLKLPLVGAKDAFLTGGIAEDNGQLWYVTGSVDGAFAVYAFDPDAPTAYSDGGLAFQLVMGGVPPAAGDTFLFSVIGAHFRWRKDGGAWNATAPVPDGVTAFDSGLSFQFIPGVKPSFVADDAWNFRVLQQWSAENVKSPDRDRWFPGYATPTLEATYAEVAPIEAIAIALHTIPEGATIQVVGGDTVGVTDWTETLTWQAGAIVKFVTRTGSWSRLELSGAGDASIGFLYIGPADMTSLSADVSLKRNYRIERETSGSGGLYQGGAFLGKAVSGTVEWTPGALSEADADMLTEMLDELKSNNDEPFIFVPQVTRPQDALLCQVVEDEIEIPDVWDYQPDVDHERRLSAKLTLQGVWV